MINFILINYTFHSNLIIGSMVLINFNSEIPILLFILHLIFLYFNNIIVIILFNLELLIQINFYLLFSFIYTQSFYGFLFGVVLLCISCYNYYNDQSIGSMWCWGVNSVMIFYAFYLLLYLPFCEKNNKSRIR